MELEELIEAAQQGDQAAFAIVCGRFEGLVKKAAWQNHVRFMAEEAMAEGWLAAAEAVQGYDRATGVPAAGFIERKVRYAVWNLFKRERRRWQREVPLERAGDSGTEWAGRPDFAADPQDVAEMVLEMELREALRSALHALPPRQREALMSAYLRSGGLVELARARQVSPQAVHNLCKRGIRRLKTALTGMYESERG